MSSRDKLVEYYFHEGQLKRVLQRLNLRRRYTPSREHLRQAEALVRQEMRGSGSLLGYRSMWRRLQNRHGFHIPRTVIAWLVANINPDDSAMRRKNRLTRRKYQNKGPNYVWHTDGMDKLKPYGFAVHGCIDGYSRRVMWLNVGVTNNNPEIIAYYYLKTVEEVRGTPRLLRSDCGTENTHLAFIQPFLRRNGSDCFAGTESFRYGRSTSNQRMEAWWSHLKRHFTQWWCTFFRGLEQNGLYNNCNFVHVDCLRLCFMNLIQKELDQIRREWNAHPIRPSKTSDCPSGPPNMLYLMPEILRVEDYLRPLDARDLHTVCEYASHPDPPGSLEFLEMSKRIMDDNHCSLPRNVQEAIELYVLLVSNVEEYLESQQ